MEEECSENKCNRLGNCEVCGSEKSQYTCPRCELKTCSLNCVKIHKKELECSGDRDKVGYVPLEKFNNLTLQSDYRFLEDVSRTIDNCKRNPLKKYTRYNKTLPPHLHRLRKEAFRRKTTIQYLPQHFTRHKENTTFFHFQSRIIYWRLEFIFPQADNIKVVLEKCDENERLSSLVSNFVDYDKCPDLYKKNLKFYHSAGLPGLEILLKAENVKIQPSFFVLDKCSTLKENFEDRIIIEYPILYVIQKSHKDEYNILDPDLEVEGNLSMGRKFLDFCPFSYFDTIQYSKNSSNDKLNKSNITALKKFFIIDEEDQKDQEDREGNKKFYRKRQKVLPKKELDIPTYENLIKQNL